MQAEPHGLADELEGVVGADGPARLARERRDDKGKQAGRGVARAVDLVVIDPKLPAQVDELDEADAVDSIIIVAWVRYRTPRPRRLVRGASPWGRRRSPTCRRRLPPPAAARAGASGGAGRGVLPCVAGATVARNAARRGWRRHRCCRRWSPAAPRCCPRARGLTGTAGATLPERRSRLAAAASHQAPLLLRPSLPIS